QEERDAGLRLGGRIGANQAEDPVGMLGQRGPGLVAVDDVVVTISNRLGADGGEVRAGARLGITLAPPVLAGEDARQKLLLLPVAAEGVDDRADHGDAERERWQRTRPSGLLLEDEPAGDRPAGAAIFPGPERRDPALLVQDAMPKQHLLLAQVGFG